MRAVLDAIAAMDADVGLIRLIVPEDGVDWARLSASVAAYALPRLQNYPPSLARLEGVDGADLQAGRIGTRPTGYDDESPLKAASRADPYGGFG